MTRIRQKPLFWRRAIDRYRCENTSIERVQLKQVVARGCDATLLLPVFQDRTTGRAATILGQLSGGQMHADVLKRGAVEHVAQKLVQRSSLLLVPGGQRARGIATGHDATAEHVQRLPWLTAQGTSQ